MRREETVEPWRERLAAGDDDAAWDGFIDRYRPVILATIQRIVVPDDVADAFAHVCQALAADRLARLRNHRTDRPAAARFSTWLVTVVHNLVVDWLRGRDGRRRVTPPPMLSLTQRTIFHCVFVEQMSHAETFERVRAANDELSFPAFLRELGETYRIVERARPRGVMRYLAAPFLPAPPDADGDERVLTSALRERLDAALASLGAEERAAVQLLIVEGMPAADVARALRWPNAKSVYNRVYRALRSLRSVFEQDGIGPGDL